MAEGLFNLPNYPITKLPNYNITNRYRVRLNSGVATASVTNAKMDR